MQLREYLIQNKVTLDTDDTTVIDKFVEMYKIKDNHRKLDELSIMLYQYIVQDCLWAHIWIRKNDRNQSEEYEYMNEVFSSESSKQKKRIVRYETKLFIDNPYESIIYRNKHIIKHHMYTLLKFAHNKEALLSKLDEMKAFDW